MEVYCGFMSLLPSAPALLLLLLLLPPPPSPPPPSPPSPPPPPLLPLLLMSTQKVQVGGQFKTTKVTCHHVPLRQHVQEASCGGVQDMRRRGPYGQDVWSP